MPIRNAKRPTMITEGEIVGLTDKEKKVLEDAGIAGDSEIPEITLILTSMEPISGTLTDDQIQILQNNAIVKFAVPRMAEAYALKIQNPDTGEMVFGFQQFTDFYTLVIDTNAKTFSAVLNKVATKFKAVDKSLVLKDYYDSDLSFIYGNEIRSVIDYKSETDPLGKYKIYEDTADTNTLVIEENW